MVNPIEEESKNGLPPLPFTYIQTLDPSKALFVVPDTGRPIKTPLWAARQRRERRDWYTSSEYRALGLPCEQVKALVGDDSITVYNWKKENPLTDQHLKELQDVFEQFSARFPQTLAFLRWILITNTEDTPVQGSGLALPDWNTILIFPSGMSLEHKNEPISFFKKIITHETQHLNQTPYREEWQTKFQWKNCDDYQEEWKFRIARLNGSTIRGYENIRTGEVSLLQFTLLPEQCISDYARISWWAEDLCETVPAYMYYPERLQDISAGKFAFLQSQDAHQLPKKVTLQRIQPADIRLPEVKAETIYYFVKKP